MTALKANTKVPTKMAPPKKYINIPPNSFSYSKILPHKSLFSK